MKIINYKQEKPSLLKQILKDKVCYLALYKEKPAEDISTELGISKADIFECIQELKEQGLIHRNFSLELPAARKKMMHEVCADYFSDDVQNEELERVNRLKNSVYYLAMHEHRSKTYISEELAISKETVQKYIGKLKNEKRIPANFSFRVSIFTEELKEKVRVLILEEKKNTIDIANELDIARSTVYSCINVLRKEGKLPSNFTPSKRTKTELKEKIYSMVVHEKKSPATIANELGYCVANIYCYIQELKAEGRLPNTRFRKNLYTNA